MRRLFQFLFLLGLAYLAWHEYGQPLPSSGAPVAADQAIATAFENQVGDLQVEGSGTVERILADDNRGSRHQRFILRLQTGQSILVAHNIDLAPRVAGLRKGDTVSFFGEYEWNPKGGTIHWTHRDPRGRHVAGWLRHNGKTYQ
ncbi:MAG: DUF3465 domain-containing protein [Gammaproteobacteria bacterium]|jgi:hypothetical protein|nr:DUF3465 domain-containing protein [Gammaproteobacteria bacterium]